MGGEERVPPTALSLIVPGVYHRGVLGTDATLFDRTWGVVGA